jgi:hypothetical protein
MSSVTKNDRQRARGRSRLAAAKNARSAGRTDRRATCRRTTASSCRSTNSLELLRTQTQKQQLQHKAKREVHERHKHKHALQIDPSTATRLYGDSPRVSPAGRRCSEPSWLATASIEFMHLCEGGRFGQGGGRIGWVRGMWWPEPMLALVATAQEVTLGLLRRLIPRPGHDCCLPGALGARRMLSPIDGPSLRTLVVFELRPLRR